MGMDDHMLSCIKALAENRIQDAKKEAMCCCLNDNTKKNAGKTAYYKKLLENGSTNMFELPANLRGLLYMKDVSDFREDRYYLGNQQKELFKQIERGVITTTKMLEYGIPYMNSTLIYGAPGTGKTEFAKYTAYKLGLPYAYLNFSYLIESYMGKTAQNLQRVFDYCKGQKCVLMLDEIDCIGLERGHDTGADVAQITGELDLIIDVDQQDKKRRRFWERWEKKDDTRITEISVAIRKSKATRPIINYNPADLIRPIKMWECPTCHAHYSYIDHKAGYCMACGQHIDWTDESMLKWRREHGKRTL